MWASLVSGLDLTLLIGNDPKSLYTKSNQQSLGPMVMGYIPRD